MLLINLIISNSSLTVVPKRRLNGSKIFLRLRGFSYIILHVATPLVAVFNGHIRLVDFYIT